VKIKSFKDLEIWKLALLITKRVYDLSAKKGFNQDLALKTQIRRAVISISSNIVEGFEKNNNNEFIRYLKIAKGSSGEVRNQLEIARMVGYISDEEMEKVDKKLGELAAQIGGFIKYLESKRTKLIRNSQSEIR